ncbi:cyclin-dependent kinase inhibitor 3 family protein [Photobacterium sp. 2_MG-2023]|uniref:Cyclin-dependent kinase inhibitor 3 family protein n=1 Tax=Photobacterium arenosum TaxID=2774143 RepID=A0ABR9BGF0_9GAMM|nr:MULTISPECIES: cyclin-dependent kinase inhibitor 3 family protein [Photobacterium]MBD8511621.1 cyclin-dependent kinase inhibitor 3 family protein [Photobacterium arenosum]MDO6582615.1 cyclin-dependent kinase inhibitor 3 family protein [Photobacterium sp. 2_MG-2023]
MTHPTWTLPVTDTSALVLTPCPGTKGVALSDSLTQLKAQGVRAVVTAINKQEMADKEVADLGQLVEQAGMLWAYTPIEDDAAPDSEFAAQWQAVSPQLHKIIAEGGNIALHCMGGSGRTGLLAAHLLLEMGWPLSRIIEDVQALRPGAFTKSVQVDYIRQVASQP